MPSVGGEIGQIERASAGGTASPYPWLETLDGMDLPLFGWEEAPEVSWYNGAANWVRYVNEVGGRTKAVLIMNGESIDGGPGRWEIVAFRACAPDEFDPLRARTTDDDPWIDVTGSLTAAARTIVGPAHCGWESTIWLFHEDRLYLRDPLGIFSEIEAIPYLPYTALPPDAMSTGLTSVDRELFTVAHEAAVYVMTPSGIERWPMVSESPGCV